MPSIDLPSDNGDKRGELYGPGPRQNCVKVEPIAISDRASARITYIYPGCAGSSLADNRDSTVRVICRPDHVRNQGNLGHVKLAIRVQVGGGHDLDLPDRASLSNFDGCDVVGGCDQQRGKAISSSHIGGFTANESELSNLSENTQIIYYYYYVLGISGKFTLKSLRAADIRLRITLGVSCE